MLYPIAIEIGDDKHAYSVIVPDVQGCYSAGDTLEEAIVNAREAIEFHISGMVEDGESIPKPSSIEVYRNSEEYKDFIFSIVDVDLSHLMGRSEKINVTLPILLIRRIDEFVATHPEYKTRSGFLAEASLERIIRS